jgi:hypothetical protein
MLREFFVSISEFLFWFTGGELLINSPWFLVWVFGGTILMLIPFYLAIKVGKNKINTLPALVFLISFFPMLLLIISPGIIQMQMIQECRVVSAEVTIEGVTEAQQIRQCRTKENFYDTNYGPWRQSKENP